MTNKKSLQVSIVYDNNAFGENLKADWGFSCLIRGLEKSILFDTGTNGKILLSNMEKLGGPCHCTGDDARKLFAEEYKENFIDLGVGKEIRVQ